VHAFEIVFSPSSRKDIKKLNREMQKRVLKKLDSMQCNPYPNGVEKLTDVPKFFRVKVGRDHRIIYSVLTDKKIIVPVVIRSRKDAYKGLNGLDPKLQTALHEIENEVRLVVGI